MNGRQVLDQFDRVVAPALGALAALVLFAMMTLTCVDVIGRYFFSRPIFGGFELTEMMLAAMIFLGLPLVTLRNEHITVDVLDPVTPDWLFRVQHIVACAIGMLSTGYLAWRLWMRATTLYTAGETTAQLKIKLGYLAYSMSLLMALTAVALFVRDAAAAAAPRPRRRRHHVIETLTGFAAFLILAFLRVPMAFAMGIVGFVGVGYMLNFNVAASIDRPGHLRDRHVLHAVGHPAVHPDGQFRGAGQALGRALSRRLLLPRPPARRPRHVHGDRLRRLRRDLRLLDRHRRDLHQGVLSLDAPVRLQRRAGGRLDRRRRHARHPDPAVGHHGDLRHHDRDQHRQAVHRRHHPRPDRDRAAVPGGDVDHAARPRRRPAGRAAVPGRSAATRSSTSGR